MPQCTCRGQRTISGVHFLFPPSSGIWGLNSGLQSCTTRALPSEPSPGLKILKVFLCAFLKRSGLTEGSQGRFELLFLFLFVSNGLLFASLSQFVPGLLPGGLNSAPTE